MYDCTLCNPESNSNTICKKCVDGICTETTCKIISQMKDISRTDSKVLNQLENIIEENNQCRESFNQTYFLKLDKFDKELGKVSNSINELLERFRTLDFDDPSYKVLKKQIANLENQRNQIQHNINLNNYIKNNKTFFEKYLLYKTDDQFDEIQFSKINKNYIELDSNLIYGDKNFLLTKSKLYSDNLIQGYRILSTKQQKLQNYLIQAYKDISASHSRCFDILDEIVMATKYDYLDEFNMDIIAHLKSFYKSVENGIEPLLTLDLITESGKICKDECKKGIFGRYSCKVNKDGSKERCNIYPKRK